MVHLVPRLAEVGQLREYFAFANCPAEHADAAEVVERPAVEVLAPYAAVWAEADVLVGVRMVDVEEDSDDIVRVMAVAEGIPG